MGKMHWDNNSDKKLLEILVNEKHTSCNKWNWTLLAKQLSACINKQVTSRQAKNHYAVLRTHYKVHARLKKMIGLARNPRWGTVDVEKEEHTERWQKFLADFPKCGLAIATKGLNNETLMLELFEGTTATGLGGCFSPTMARGASYLSKNVADLFLNEESVEVEDDDDEEEDNYEGTKEGSGDNDDIDSDRVGVNLNVSSAALSVSPPKTVRRKVSGATSSKRKSEGSIDDLEQKRRKASFDNVIELLEISVYTNPSTRYEKVVESLSRMKVLDTKGQHYYVRALKYLEDEKVANMFLDLEEDEHKCMYLDGTLPTNI